MFFHLIISDHRSVIGRVKYVFAEIYRSIVNLNLFTTLSANIAELQDQRLYTRVYLVVYSISLGLFLFYAEVIERKIIKTHRITSVTEYERLHEQYADGLNCPCMHISIPYNDFVTELRVQAFHQSCLPGFVKTVLAGGKVDRATWNFSHSVSANVR